MKRSEAIKLLIEKMQELNLESSCSGLSSPADEKEAEAIIKLFEDLDIIDSSRLSSKCSRCDRGGWSYE